MRDIWVVSDTHFNHGNIIKYCDRPYESSKDMDWDMVEKWNSVVKPGDKVYHLGDVYMSASKGYIENLLSKLHGQKRLVLGNHDNGKDQILQKYFEKIVVWRMFPEFGLLLTHVPVHESALNRGKKGRLSNVHGHIHQNPSPQGPYFCACVEQTGYKPVHIEDIRRLV